MVVDTHGRNRFNQAWLRRRLAHTKRRTKEIVVAGERRHVAVRRRLAAQYLHGSGIEIGALQMPLRLPAGASVRYVDRFDIAQLRAHYPELDDFELVAPDIIDDGEVLATVPDESAGFLIANHMIEHCEDPIGTLSNHLRVLKPGGVLFMAVPDRRFTFDREREPTPLAHLVRDHAEGPGWSRRTHFEEWARFVAGAAPDRIAAEADALEAQDYSIHFHVWTPISFLELLAHCRSELELALEVDAMERNDHEFLVVMRRVEAPSSSS
jgi:SAM-dependent methyltransferase